EIRTPMNAIKGMTDILLRRAPKVEQLSYLKAIKDSSGSLLVIINDILDLSKIEADKVSLEHIPFSLEEVVHNVATVMQFKAEEKGLELKTNIDQSVPAQVLGDPTRLHQVLLNLLGNAVKFTEKGLVSIRLSVEPDDGANQIVTKFCVSDTGVGMDESRLDKIFESFEQAYSDTSRKFGGTGLGLSISKKLVELQRGRIWAESEKGKGSRFYVSIPYEMAGEEERAPATALDSGKINPAEALKGIKVLLAEDNAFNAIVAQEELEDAIGEVEVVVAENGAIAVEQATHDDFDVILMDVQMPVMNGYEATQKIRLLDNGKANIPIIAMTANVMKEEVERCYEAGMNDFIGKPFETEVLMGKLAKYCRAPWKNRLAMSDWPPKDFLSFVLQYQLPDQGNLPQVIVAVLDHAFNISPIVAIFFINKGLVKFFIGHLRHFFNKFFCIGQKLIHQFMPILLGSDGRKAEAVLVSDLERSTVEHIQKPGQVIVDVVGQRGNGVQASGFPGGLFPAYTCDQFFVVGVRYPSPVEQYFFQPVCEEFTSFHYSFQFSRAFNIRKIRGKGKAPFFNISPWGGRMAPGTIWTLAAPGCREREQHNAAGNRRRRLITLPTA
ncbi:MAG: response regulator, partial [Phaeodactylibacter sp.]|nr:response regulator [Phaeodactylibacter sp.]